MRQYDDPVEVRRGEEQDPDQFLWRGRLWKVRAVVAHWVETGPWRHGAADRDGEAGGLPAGRELWRVEAGRGAPPVRPLPDEGSPPTHGVFDLSFDGTDGRWQLVGSLD